MTKNKYGGMRGWFKESKRHSLARMGIKTGKKEAEKRRINYYKTYYSQERFNELSRQQQRGIIIDLAKKAFAGVGNAITWEKQHLPNQAKWVKNEYKEAKEAINKAYQNLKSGNEVKTNKVWLQDYVYDAGGDAEQFIDNLKKPTPQYIDAKEVKDEKDHDEDGISDITDETLDAKNYEIKQQLTGYNEVKDKKTKLQKKKKRREREKEDFFKVINIVGSQKEKAEINKLKENPDATINLSAISDATLEELAVREPENIFTGNKYENELFRRLDKRERLNKRKVETKQKYKEKRKELKKELKGTKKSILDEIFSI